MSTIVDDNVDKYSEYSHMTQKENAPSSSAVQKNQQPSNTEQFSAEVCLEAIDYLLSLHHENVDGIRKIRVRRAIRTEVNLVKRFQAERPRPISVGRVSRREKDWHNMNCYLWKWAGPYPRELGPKELQDILRVMLTGAMKELSRAKMTSRQDTDLYDAIERSGLWLGNVAEVEFAKVDSREFVKKICAADEAEEDVTMAAV